MPTDQMLMERFQEIMQLMQMEEGEIEQSYGLRPGNGTADAYRQGIIISICKMSIDELQGSINLKAEEAQRAAFEEQQRMMKKNYKGVAAGDIPPMMS